MRLVIDLQGAQGSSRRRGIGRYSRALALAMAENRGSHDVWVALSENYPDTIQDLRDEFRPFLPPDRIVTWKAPSGTAELLPDSGGRRDAAERLRVAFLSSLRPDLIHVSSLFEGFGEDMVTGVPADTELPRAVYTLYDLIPFLQQDAYLPSEQGRQWYFRRLLHFRRAAGLLAISESSRSEAVEHLRFPGDRVFNILAGVDPKFRPAAMAPDVKRALLARYGLPDGFVFCVGAVEPRKNVDGLIRAYALLPPELRARHKLVATAWNDPLGLDELRRVVAQAGLPQGDVLLLEQFVLEDDLPKLYQACALSVLPSFHEGFGLPAAEAMAAGAPVIGSRATSIPEVIGRDDALFDPGRPEDMAARMEAVLTRPAFRADLVRDGLERARLFSWEETAKRAWLALEAIHAGTGPGQERAARGRAVPLRKPRLSVVTPLLDGHLGGQTTPRGSLLAGLTRHYDVELVHPGSEGPSGPDLPARAPEHDDRVLYLPAGDPACSALMLDALEGRPGVVALEGASPLRPLLRDGSRAGEAAFRRASLDAHGWPALVLACRAGAEAAADRYSGVAHVMGRAVAMLACSEAEAAVLRDARRELPGRARRPMLTVPASDWGAADAWRDAIETAYAESPVAAMEACVAAAAAAARSSPCGGGGTLAEVAASLAETFDADAGKRMLLDVTGIAESDAGTGIQRVVKETARCLARRDDLGARVELVRSTEGGLWSARAFGARVLHLDGVGGDVPQTIGRDDIYVGLDLRLHEAEMLVGEMRRVKLRGGKAVGVVYDLLPLQFPSHFPEPVRLFYPAWLRALGRTADGLMCISRAVADQLCDWLDAERPERRAPLGVGFFHLGSDFLPAPHPEGDRPDPAAADVLAAMASRPTLLMVGTIEPRKGHAQAIEAMEALWRRGAEVGLVIAGRAGWLVDELIRRVRTHPEFGRRLHWSEAPSDAVLPSLYRNAGALLMASEGEGFGLPIVEAARAGLSVIARDLPVFREVAGEHATYFSGPVTDPAPLAAAVRDWLDSRARGRAPDAKLIRTLSWQESALEFADRVINERWYRVWSPGPGAAPAPGA